jgi:hypothetical protein
VHQGDFQIEASLVQQRPFADEEALPNCLIVTSASRHRASTRHYQEETALQTLHHYTRFSVLWLILIKVLPWENAALAMRAVLKVKGLIDSHLSNLNFSFFFVVSAIFFI